MSRLKVFLYLIFLLSIFFCSCVNTKQFRYFQDISDTSAIQSLYIPTGSPLKIQVNDQLQVIISSESPDASKPFIIATSSNPLLQNVYAVGLNGKVTMPVLGDIQAAGLTTDEFKNLLITGLTDYLKSPIISVRIVNFKVTVIGEFNRPQVLLVDGERLNVLQALGMAGDMSLYGNRKNVKVMRTVKDSIKVGYLDFTSTKIVESPYFQLQQNDVVYIEPLKSKSLKGESFAFWIPIILSIVSTVFLITWRLSR